ncbi:MAG: hypothetical protein HXS40_00210 [Theionarchaea archaeon]|nr:hypothetical protein [Theionarchaea archaeon]
MKPFTAVGRKLILLLACSILKVNNGVPAIKGLAVADIKGLAVADIAATNATTIPIAAIDIFFFSIVSPPICYHMTATC